MSQAAALLAEAMRLAQAGLGPDALPLLDRAVAIDGSAQTLLAQGRVRLLMRDMAGAGFSLAAAHDLAPADPAIAAERARLDIQCRRPSAALALVDTALAMAPPTARLLRERGSALMLTGDIAGAIASWRAALAIDPRDWLTASNIAYALMMDPKMTTAGLRDAQRPLFAGMAPAGMASPPPAPPPSADGRLHIGYVSACFHRHAGARVFVPMITRHDRGRVRITCYSAVARHDATTVRLRFAVDGWRSIAGIDDAAAAAMIRADGVRVLVDLDGHLAQNRLGVFAHQPAPVQISAWGYLPGTGVPGLDHLVTDPVLIPQDERAGLRETDRPLDVVCPTLAEPLAPPPDARPAPDTAPAMVRLGCLARIEKLSDPLLDIWGQVLAARPATVLVLHDDMLDDPVWRRRLDGWCDRYCLGPGRVERLRRDGTAYLPTLRGLDIALDTYPYSGGLMTLDALSQGVPVVTLAGHQPSARTTASILSCLIGDPALIARTADGYRDAILALIDAGPRRHALHRDLLATHHARLAAAIDQAAAGFERHVLALTAARPGPSG